MGWRLYRFARTQGGRYVAEVMVGARRGRSYTQYEVEARPAGALVIQTWPKSMAAVVHTRSIGLVSMPDGSTWHFLLTGPTVDKQAFVEKFDAAGKYIGQVPVDFGVKVYARGGQATLEVRGYRDGLFYLIDETDYPCVRVVRLVEKRSSR